MAIYYFSSVAWSVLCVVAAVFASIEAYSSPTVVTPIADPPVRIGAFNIRVFGKSKYSDVLARDVLSKILSRYDILLVQEIRDALNKSIHDLLHLSNRRYRTNDPLSLVISERLGRTSSKEQYAFLYRRSSVEVMSTYQYPDRLDKFERPPFAVKFRSKTFLPEEFIIIGLHTSPDDAVSEINAMYEVFAETRTVLGAENVLIAGDLNADCSYVKEDMIDRLTIRADAQFTWLIDDDTDTTVSGTHCAYDRFVTAGPAWSQALIPNSAGVFYFDKEYGLGKEEALSVSDHYPVEMDLTGIRNLEIQSNVMTSISAKFEDIVPLEKLNQVQVIYSKSSAVKSLFWEVEVYKVNTRNSHVEASKTSISRDAVIEELLKFHRATNNRIPSKNLISMVDAYINNEYDSTFQNEIFIYGLKQIPKPKTPIYDVVVTCTLQNPYTCSVELTKRIS